MMLIKKVMQLKDDQYIEDLTFKRSNRKRIRRKTC